ncbi:MAG: tetraacyldisaccharide 4'-kinase [Saprospiraceae bacterium]
MIQDPLIRILLAPISFLYGVGVSIRDFFYRKRLLLSFKFDVPVISVGNLSVGGAGKTPHIEYLIRLLKPYLNVATLSRGYRRKTVGYRIVEVNNRVEEVGDEPLMFKRKYPDVFVTVNEQRALGISQIVQNRPDTQAILLDDAFQHRAVQPGLNILLTEFNHPFTRDYLLPSGRLREWRSSYHRADIIIVSKCPEDLTEEEKNKMTFEINPYPHQQIYFSSYRYLRPYYILNPRYQLDLTEEMSVLMVCAIAGTEYMQDYLESKVGAVRVKAFTDHHLFEETDLEEIWKMFEAMPGNKKLIVTTEKDAMRLAAHREWLMEKKIPMVVLPVEVYFHFDGQEKFDAEVKQFLLDFKV